MNIGNSVEITIKQIATMIKTIVCYNGEIVFNSNYPDGQPRRCIDTTKSKQKSHTVLSKNNVIKTRL